MANKVFVEGEPPTFNYPMNPRERAWRAQVLDVVAGWNLGPAQGIRAEFVVSSDKRGGHSFDLDNLAKPVFDAFSGSTPQFVEVTRRVGHPPGVGIEESSTEPEVPQFQCWVSMLWRGSKRDTIAYPGFADILVVPAVPVHVHLCFHEPVSLTNFGLDAEAVIKPTIDHLWPVLGGTPGRPNDHRIIRLAITQGHARSSGVSLYVAEVGA